MVGSSPVRVKQKTNKLVFAAFPLSTQHLKSKIKDWLARNQDNMSKEATCLPIDRCFSDLAL
jgi:hypothetical protein